MNFTTLLSAALLANLTFGQAPSYGSVDMDGDWPTFKSVVHDWTGDGIPDVLATKGPGVSLWIGTGDGIVTPTDLLTGVGGLTLGGLGDLDGDGVEDLVLVKFDGGASIVALIADGSGGFTRVDSSVFTASNQSVSGIGISDIDGDGDQDVVASIWIGPGAFGAPAPPGFVTTLLGDGAGSLTPSGLSIPIGPRTSALLMADYDGDGIDDVAVASEDDDDVRVLRGDGVGGFALLSTTSVAADPHRLAAADFDQDGTLDIAVAFRVGSEPMVLSGSSAGGFTAASVATAGSRWAVEAGDVNGDGWVDLICSGVSPAVCLNDQAGGFGLPSISVHQSGYSLATGDMNNDGLLDLVVGDNSKGGAVLLGDGVGTFAAGSSLSESAVRMTSADLNNDGREDLIYSRDDTFAQFGVWTRVALGNGTYAPSGVAQTDLQPYRILMTDWNADGNLDALVLGAKFAGFTGAPIEQSLVVLEGNGAGGLSVVEQLPLAQFAFGIAAGDLDNNGFFDVLVAQGGIVTRYELDALGAIGAPQPMSYNSSAGLLIADVVGDARPDVVSASGTTLRLYENTGVGTDFPVSLTHSTAGGLIDLAVNDLDDDGGLDLVGWSSSTVTAILLNGSSAASSTTPLLATGVNFVPGLALGDVDGDGLIDAVVGGTRAQVLHGELTGFATWYAIPGLAKDVTLCDANDDGYLELVVASSTLLIHAHRELAPLGVRPFGTGTPGCRGTQLALTNRSADLGAADFRFTCNQAPPNSIGLCAGSQNIIEAGASVLGITTHLNPAGPLFRLDVVISDANGMARFAEVIPSSPGLAGLTYARQFIWDWSGVGNCSPSPLGWSTSRGVEITLQ